jgi:ATP-binding cassette subfamily C protein CydCD
MQRRVAFSAVLAANASVILLDEPTANLDKENAEIIRELIKEAAKTALIIIASHVTEDVALADEVIKI